ncbi:mitochondrial transcription rescue factor 1 [Platichthys flesus]|uniref:mitochondrial transcription rescue factor 1 n=1 Tax=Platichthys flesus TaxID=8260 RepID=UPI002DC00E56|nr:mitochondrial transcription rescue factor 1 [Platichthys flesus]XP_062253355.1 mitochondrial transcription rescue factor 1 [Platichthys flesus]
MQNLVVQSLAMRQLGRLNPRHLLAAEYGLRQSRWCPRSIHTRQLWGCSSFPMFGCHRPTPHGRDSLRSWSVHHLRSKSIRKKETAPTAQMEEEDEDEKDPEDNDDDDQVDMDPNQPKEYKDMEKYVKSFRYDGIMKAGLDMANKKIEDAFYSNKLRLNGQKLIKKSKMVKAGDTLDMVLSENQAGDTVTLMRVIVRSVFEETSKKEKYKVAIRRWKSIELSKDEAFKP